MLALTLFLLLIWSHCIFGNVPFLAEARSMCLGGGDGCSDLKYFEKNTHIVKGFQKVSEKQLLFFYSCCAKLVLWSKKSKNLVLKLCLFLKHLQSPKLLLSCLKFLLSLYNFASNNICVCTIFLWTVLTIGVRECYGFF